MNKIKTSIDKKEKKVFFYLNSYSFYLVHHKTEFEKAFNSADYILVDGMSIVYLMRKRKFQHIQKVTPNHSFFNYLEDFYKTNKTRIFLLGTNASNIQQAEKNLRARGLNICGFHDGFFNVEESETIIDKINYSKPEILFVGIGMPKCEEWITLFKEKFSNYTIISVGNLLDIFANKVSIAPSFLFNTPFEWIFRLILEPRKLLKRYLLSNTFIIKKLINGKY